MLEVVDAPAQEIICRYERLTDALAAELTPLMQAHHAEIEAFDDLPLDPDWDTYWRIQQNCAMAIITARHDGTLIGYDAFIVNQSLHHRTVRMAIEDGLYVTPIHRDKGLGSKLIRAAHRELKTLGVSVVFHHCKHRELHNIGPLLARLGGEHIDDVWSFRLDGG